MLDCLRVLGQLDEAWAEVPRLTVIADQLAASDPASASNLSLVADFEWDVAVLALARHDPATATTWLEKARARLEALEARGALSDPSDLRLVKRKLREINGGPAE